MEGRITLGYLERRGEIFRSLDGPMEEREDWEESLRLRLMRCRCGWARTPAGGRETHGMAAAAADEDTESDGEFEFFD